MLRRWLDGGRRDRIGIPNATPGLAGLKKDAQYILAAVDNDPPGTAAPSRHLQNKDTRRVAAHFPMAQMACCVWYFTWTRSCSRSNAAWNCQCHRWSRASEPRATLQSHLPSPTGQHSIGENRRPLLSAWDSKTRMTTIPNRPPCRLGPFGSPKIQLA